MADGRLGHVQLLRRAREAEMAGGGLERAERGERREAVRDGSLLGMSSPHALHEKVSLVKGRSQAHLVEQQEPWT
jgi:hypothetical protein